MLNQTISSTNAFIPSPLISSSQSSPPNTGKGGLLDLASPLSSPPPPNSPALAPATTSAFFNSTNKEGDLRLGKPPDRHISSHLPSPRPTLQGRSHNDVTASRCSEN
ncbi:unnamed protein product [Linum tenue]|uniref:Uncharacterized protein n=1 Tax=Linum tenue TaxID=586396 RepID=A0AAV0MQA3_9ROSI|nr:unnamed protein product [Linum tenue]